MVLPATAAPQPSPSGAPARLLAPPDAAPRVHPEIRRALARLGPGEMTTVIVTLKAQARVRDVKDSNRSNRLKRLVRTLRDTAQQGQGRLRERISLHGRRGRVAGLKYLWVFNGLALTATADVIEDLARQPEVFSIEPNRTLSLPSSPDAASPPEPNIEHVQAPAVWALGSRGQGVVVASMDSGVDVAHPDLAGRWRGGDNSWFDPHSQHPTPVDRDGHGTATMSLMVGGSAGGTAIGVAPDARWIAVKMFDDAGQTTVLDIHEGFQWLLDPDGNPDIDDAPHVVNNSWGITGVACDRTFGPDLQALRAAGILPIFAAGNSGPNPGTGLSPADNPEAFAVGATDNSDVVAYFSSRGPDACGGGAFPDVVAPGYSVLSAALGASYKTVSGTSFAAPTAAGVLALILGAFPDLTAEQQEAALLAGAVDVGAAGPDNDSGRGALNALQAFRAAAGIAAGSDPGDAAAGGRDFRSYLPDIFGRVVPPAH